MTGAATGHVDGTRRLPYQLWDMFNLSRRTLGILCITGFVLAAAGWITAWNTGRSKDQAEPAASANRASSNRKSGSRPLNGVMDTKLVSDPRSIRLVELMEKLDQGALPGQPNAAFLKAAELTLNDSLFHRRQRDFRLLMEKMRPEDALAIHEQFKKLEREGRYFGNEYGAFAMRWGQIDGAGAMAYWSAREPFDMPHRDMVEVVTGWAHTDPEKTLAWIDGHKDLVGDMNAYRPLLVGWLDADPVAATTWLANSKLDPQLYADCVNGAVLDKVYSDGVEGASDWLAALPDGDPELGFAAKAGWMTHVGRLGNLDPGLAAAAWSKVGSKSWMGPQEFQSFCNSVAHGNEGSLDAFAEQLSQRWPGTEASAQFGRWTAENPDAVGSVLARLPASGIRKAGVEGMLQALEKSDPGLAETWRKQLGE